MIWLTIKNLVMRVLRSLGNFASADARNAAILVLLALGTYGYWVHRAEINSREAQIYKLGSLNKHVVVAAAPKRSLKEKLLGIKKLPKPTSVPEEKLNKVIAVDCGTHTVVIAELKDGTVISEDPNVSGITVEEYEKTYGPAFGLRLATLSLPKASEFKPGMHVQLYKYRKAYFDVTGADDFIGIGFSTNPKIWVFENLYVAGGYGYHFTETLYMGYLSLSVRL